MELKIFENEQFGQVRIAMNDSGEPMFCLADLCTVLDLTPSKVSQRLEEDVLSKYPLLTAGGIQQANFVNEDGLYDVILDSRKPEAKKFRKWITSEILPSIRKTGSYSVKLKLPSYAEALRQLADKVEENERLQIENKDMKPKADYFDTLVERGSNLNLRDTAKMIGVSERFFIEYLLLNGYLYRDAKRKLKPIAKYVGKYFVLKEWVRGENTGSQTLVTVEGKDKFYKLINK
jgi:prophage antirepressor-like protein|nr:MAG TPA: repressor domain protein [Caudoviricetes sp.]